MARRGDSHITNRSDDRRPLCRIELNLHLRSTRANSASEREHDCSIEKTAVHGLLLLLARSHRYGRSRPTARRCDQSATFWPNSVLTMTLLTVDHRGRSRVSTTAHIAGSLAGCE